ncbi:hypothetical protein HU200_046535 [Digitaria exilis]|uniref:Uncharacterized protein n=1 Tax=Digitaria exilis TaxID=1010633 RepID=A0A835EAV7_9POAL|nr:hypothetical protein HU200_046535 [Digitaria exilis]
MCLPLTLAGDDKQEWGTRGKLFLAKPSTRRTRGGPPGRQGALVLGALPSPVRRRKPEDGSSNLCRLARGTRRARHTPQSFEVAVAEGGGGSDGQLGLAELVKAAPPPDASRNSAPVMVPVWEGNRQRHHATRRTGGAAAITGEREEWERRMTMARRKVTVEELQRIKKIREIKQRKNKRKTELDDDSIERPTRPARTVAATSTRS